MISPGERPIENDASPWMNLDEFVEKGYLHEVNRQFFHPLGLALTVRGSGGRAVEIIGIIDHRDDPEGIYFGQLNWDKIFSIRDEQERRRYDREFALGYWVQGEP